MTITRSAALKRLRPSPRDILLQSLSIPSRKDKYRPHLQLSEEMDEYLDRVATECPNARFWRQKQSAQARSMTLLPLKDSGRQVRKEVP